MLILYRRDSSCMLCSVYLHSAHSYQVIRDTLCMLLRHVGLVVLNLAGIRLSVHDTFYSLLRHYDSDHQVPFRLPDDGLSAYDIPHRFRYRALRRLQNCLLQCKK